MGMLTYILYLFGNYKVRRGNDHQLHWLSVTLHFVELIEDTYLVNASVSFFCMGDMCELVIRYYFRWGRCNGLIQGLWDRNAIIVLWYHPSQMYIKTTTNKGGVQRACICLQLICQQMEKFVGWFARNWMEVQMLGYCFPIVRNASLVTQYEGFREKFTNVFLFYSNTIHCSIIIMFWL